MHLMQRLPFGVEQISIASRRTSSAFGSPIVITVTSAPYSSFKRSAASRPALSSGFNGAKVSYSVEAAMAKLYAAEVAMEVTGLNFTPPFVSGTCFTQTTIFTLITS